MRLWVLREPPPPWERRFLFIAGTGALNGGQNKGGENVDQRTQCWAGGRSGDGGVVPKPAAPDGNNQSYESRPSSPIVRHAPGIAARSVTAGASNRR